MLGRIKRTTAISIVFTFLLYIFAPLYVHAALDDTAAIFSKWKTLGLISSQSEIYTKSDEPIKRLEFFTLINKIFRYEEKDAFDFPDVVKNAWYSGEIARAVAAGYLKNAAGTNASPFQPLTRLDAAIIISDVFDLQAGSQNSLNNISDADKIPSQYKSAVSSVLEKEVFKKSQDGRFVPFGTISRASIVTMLDGIMGVLINKSGVYSTKNNKNILVNTAEVTLSNITVNGDLYLTEGVGSGNILIQNVNITGRTIVRGGGANTVIFRNSSLSGGLFVMKKDGKVRLVTEENTSISKTSLKSGALLEEKQGKGEGFQEVSIDGLLAKGQQIGLKGAYTTVKTQAEGVGIKLDGTAAKLEIGKMAIGTTFSMTGGVLDNLDIRAARTSTNITGGIVKNLVAFNEADTPKIIIDGSTVYNMEIQTQTTVNFPRGMVQTFRIGENAGGTIVQTSVNAKINSLVANSETSVNGSGSIVYASINSNGVILETKPSSTSIKDGVTAVVGGGSSAANNSFITLGVGSGTVEVTEGSTTASVVTVSPNTALLTYSSLNPAIASVDEKGVITGVGEGTTTIYVTASLNGYNKEKNSFIVNVLSRYKTKAGVLTVTPAVQAAGAKSTLVLEYKAGMALGTGAGKEGVIVFTLPFGFSPTAGTDSVSIAGAAAVPLTAAQISGQKVTISGLTLSSGGKVSLTLSNKTIPVVGTYSFFAKADADGAGKDKTFSSGTGGESAVFTANSIKKLKAGVNYGTILHGSQAGTAMISDLSLRDISDAKKWIVKIQNAVFAVPELDDVLNPLVPGDVIDGYTAGRDIPVLAGQHMVLLAVDDAGRIKAFEDITVTAGMIKPYNAAELTAGSFSVPVPGVSGSSASIVTLPDLSNYTGAVKWMVKVQNANLTTPPYVGTKLEGAVNYTAGADITVKADQYIILMATANDGGIIAYTVIRAANGMIREAAREMKDVEGWYLLPVIGTSAGTALIPGLDDFPSLNANYGISATKWQVKVQNDPFGIPAKDSSIVLPSPGVIDNYSQGQNIPVNEGQHLILLAVNDAGHIKAYRDFTIAAAQIRPADAVQLVAGVNYISPSRGTKPGTTLITGLDLAGITGAATWRIKLQDTALTNTPFINSIMEGTSIYNGTELLAAVGQHLVLLATDGSQKIKAYKDITLTEAMIKPLPVPALKADSNYSLPEKGTANGTTKIRVLDPVGFVPVSEWRVAVQNEAFTVPSMGDLAFGNIYTAGNEIAIDVNQHLLLLAIGPDNKIKAYADMIITGSQIKAPPAPELIIDKNYSAPEKGSQEGTTRITMLKALGVIDSTGWRIKISNNAIPAPDYNSVEDNTIPYSAGADISISENKYVVLLATDAQQKIKAYKNIQVSKEMIKSVSAGRLVVDSNYSKAVPGQNVGTTEITILNDVGFETIDTWWYKVSDNVFGVPSVDDVASVANGFTAYAAGGDIPVITGQNLLLVGAGAGGKIVAYASFAVTAAQIKSPPAAELQLNINYTAPTAGTLPGTTTITNLYKTGFLGITRWWVKVENAGISAPDYDSTLNNASTYNEKGNIPITKGQYIILYGTDDYSHIKGYAAIHVNNDAWIKPNLAAPLKAGTNFSAPEPGSVDGATMISVLNGIGFEPVAEWRYAIQNGPFEAPNVTQTVLGTSYYTNPGGFVGGVKDITVNPGQHLLLLAIGEGKVKAYADLTISESQINAPAAGMLVAGTNYSAPIPGNQPGTTKINTLQIAGFLDITKWWYRVSSEAFAAPDYNSVLAGGTIYSAGSDIPVILNQHIFLLATDNSNRIKAYADILMDEPAEIKPEAAPKLTAGVNYKLPEPGDADGKTQIKLLSFDGFTNTAGWQWKYRIQNSQFEVPLLGVTDALAAGFAADDDLPSSGTVTAGQHLLLLATDGAGKTKAYADITLTAAMIKAMGAVKLLKGNGPGFNYSNPEPGAANGTTKIVQLESFGIAGATKWQVIVRNFSINGVAPALDSRINGAVTYTAGADIIAADGQYLVLLATDDSGNIKGYDEIKLTAVNIRLSAAALSEAQCSTPVEGSVVGTAKVQTLAAINTIPEATRWMYKVQEGAFGTVLKDSVLSGVQVYNAGNNIPVLAGQHLIIIATDDNSQIKAYREFVLAPAQIKAVKAFIEGTAAADLAEADINTGGKTIKIVLQDGIWANDTVTDQVKRNSLFDAFKPASEALEWTKVASAMKAEGEACIDRASDGSYVLITLPEIPLYNITANQIISLDIPIGLVNGVTSVLTAAPSFIVAATVGAVITGTLTSPAASENVIAEGGKTIIITLSNGQWVTDIASNQVKREALFDGFAASGASIAEWDKVVAALKLTGQSSIIRNSSSKVTLTLPAVATYNITGNQTIKLTIPNTSVIGAIRPIIANPEIPVAAIISAAITGTAVEGTVSETDIVNGGKTVVITLANGRWASDIAIDRTKRELLFDAFTAGSDTSEWGKVLLALKGDGQAAITRNSDTQVTVILPTTTGYRLSGNQSVTLKIPPSLMEGAITTVTASPSIVILAAQKAVLTGTITNSAKESDVAAGGKTIILTLSNCQWTPDILTNPDKLSAIINGITAASEAAEWNKVKAGLTAASFVRNSNTQLTITLPAVPSYNIAAEQSVSIIIPQSVLVGASGAVLASPAFKIASAPPIAAAISSVGALTANGTYIAGQTIGIIITFNNSVEVDTSGGVPVLQLETGTVDRNAVYSAGSGTSVLTFNYIIQPGDASSDLDYKGTTALVLSGGSIKNTGTSVNAVLILPAPGAINSLGSSKAIVIDTAAPVNAASYPKAGVLAETTASILVKSNEAGKGYFVALAAAAIAPNPQQVKAGLDANGNLAGVINSGNANITANIEAILNVAGLSAKTAYDIYIVLEDTAGNLQAAPFKIAVTTLDKTPPQFSANPQPYPFEGTVTDTTAEVLVKISEDGKAYMVLLPDNAAAPSPAQVKAGKNAAGAAVAANFTKNIALTANTEGLLQFTGLVVSTDYDIYTVCEDIYGNLQDTAFKLDISTGTLILTGVGMNVGGGILTNTNTFMQYSLNSKDLGMPGEVNGSWQNCMAGNTTGVNLIAGQVWIREAAHPDNFRKVGDILPPRDAPLLSEITSSNYDVINTISGMDNTMEFKAGNSAIWTSGENAAEGQFAGTLTVWVRYKGDQATLPSISQGVYFTANIDLTGVAVDVSAGVIKNTSVSMQYSLDSTDGETDGTWYTCTAGTTAAEFIEGKVYVRAAGQPENYRLAATITQAEAPELTGISYNIGAGTITGTPDTAQYRVGDGDWINVSAGGTTSAVNFMPGYIELRIKAGATYLASLPVTIGTVADAAEAPKAGTKAEALLDPLIEVVYDDAANSLLNTAGVILGRNYEYKIDSGAWTLGDVAGNFKGYKTVLVRKRADALKLPSQNSTINFTANTLVVKAVGAGANIGLGINDKISITFEENTNKPQITAVNLDSWIKPGNGHSFGTALTNGDIVWNTAGNILTVILSSIDGTTITPGDTITIDAAAGIKNSAGTSPASIAAGIITGSFSSVSVAAANAGNNLGLGIGDKVTITFEENTNKPVITAAELDNWLQLKDSQGNSHSWGSNLQDSDIVWSLTGKTLTITFSNITNTTITARDTLTILPGAGIKNSAGTSQECAAAVTMTGTFTSAPVIQSVAISNGGAAGVKDAGDKVTITFNQNTNKPPITAAYLNTWLKLNNSHSWGSGTSFASVSWNAAGNILTVTYTNTSGCTLAAGDKITLSASANIKDSAMTTPAATSVSPAISGGP